MTSIVSAALLPRRGPLFNLRLPNPGGLRLPRQVPNYTYDDRRGGLVWPCDLLLALGDKLGVRRNLTGTLLVASRPAPDVDPDELLKLVTLLFGASLAEAWAHMVRELQRQASLVIPAEYRRRYATTTTVTVAEPDLSELVELVGVVLAAGEPLYMSVSGRPIVQAPAS